MPFVLNDQFAKHLFNLRHCDDAYDEWHSPHFNKVAANPNEANAKYNNYAKSNEIKKVESYEYKRLLFF